MSLMEQYGIKTNLFNIVAGGSRTKIYKDIDRIFQDTDCFSIILIDSEKEIPYDEKICKWDFLYKNEKWNKPKDATEDNLYFMAACMESWIVADEDALQSFYREGFKAKLPHATKLNTVAKDTILKSLKESTKECGKKYDKKDSFQILEKVDVNKIAKSNIYAKEFFDFLRQKQENNP